MGILRVETSLRWAWGRGWISEWLKGMWLYGEKNELLGESIESYMLLASLGSPVYILSVV